MDESVEHDASLRPAFPGFPDFPDQADLLAPRENCRWTDMTRTDVLSARPSGLLAPVGLALVGVFAVGREWVQPPVPAAILTLGMVALHAGPRRNLALADRTPWRLLRLGGYLFIVVSLIR